MEAGVICENHSLVTYKNESTLTTVHLQKAAIHMGRPLSKSVSEPYRPLTVNSEEVQLAIIEELMKATKGAQQYYTNMKCLSESSGQTGPSHLFN